MLWLNCLPCFTAKVKKLITVTIENLDTKPLEAKRGEKLLDVILRHGIDYMHACGGKGRCTTCKAKITFFEDELPADTEVELKYREAGRLKIHERLSCQLTIFTSLSLIVPKETQLPHLNYTSYNA
jgi:ferredoxin, 2Fe-2S